MDHHAVLNAGLQRHVSVFACVCWKERVKLFTAQSAKVLGDIRLKSLDSDI